MSLEDHITIETRDPDSKAFALKSIKSLPHDMIRFTPAGEHRRLRVRSEGNHIGIGPYAPDTINIVFVPEGATQVAVHAGTYYHRTRGQSILLTQTLLDFSYCGVDYRIFCR